MLPKCTDNACDFCSSLNIVGSHIREHVHRELPAKVVLRKARDVVLLTGPTGSGKELIASACHRAAKDTLQRNGELVQVNCANLGHGVFESELFGYKRGAFTGADRNFPGLVGKADNGTLVLDEIQTLSPKDQARLLRFLGEREYRSVGDDRIRRSNALIILASNRDLPQMAAEGSFRRDIIDRAPAKIEVPALYQRRDDIAQLAQAFAQTAAEELDAEDFAGFTRRALADIETAIARTREVSVRRLREVVRDIVFSLAIDSLPTDIDSDLVGPFLERAFDFDQRDRDLQDQHDMDHGFDALLAQHHLSTIVDTHSINPRVLSEVCRAVQSMIAEMDSDERDYRNICARTQRLSKVALWLVSGAETQAEFRRFFGDEPGQMPTKSVAHQIYHEVFPKGSL